MNPRSLKHTVKRCFLQASYQNYENERISKSRVLEEKKLGPGARFFALWISKRDSCHQLNR